MELNKFSNGQLNEIKEGLDVRIYAKLEFNTAQM